MTATSLAAEADVVAAAQDVDPVVAQVVVAADAAAKDAEVLAS